MRKSILKGNVDMKKKLSKKVKKERGITLIALIVTIVVLLILAGISITLLIGENGVLSRAKTAGEKYQEAENEEQNRLASYEDEMDNWNTRAENEKSYKETILFDGNEETKDIIFLDNHKASEFDTLIFVYGLVQNNKYTTILESEYRLSTWEFAIQYGKMDVNHTMELNGWGQRNMGISNISDTGCKVTGTTEYHLFRILGVNYK